MLIKKAAQTDQEYAGLVAARGRGLFLSKETRDRVCKLLAERHRDEGIHSHIGVPRRRVVNNQQLHPEYITDYVGTLEVGIFNTQYQMSWSKLYAIEMVR